MSGTAQAGGGDRAAAAGPRGVLGLLREPGWRRGLALAVAVAVACLLLGQWQWHRRQARLAANAPLVQNYDDAPVALDSVLPGGAPLAARDAWTPVRVSGTYDADATVLARNRQQGRSVGYDVLVPLVLDDGTALLVDRGWVPAGSSSRAPDAVPAPPGGEVTVTAHVRPWEPERAGTVPEGQVVSIAAGPVARAAAAAGAAPALRDAFAVLVEEEPAPARAPAAPERPEVDEGPHLAYTVQWYGFALTALVVWVVAGRRELQARAVPVDAPAAVGGAPGSGAAEPSGAGPSAVGTPRAAAPRRAVRGARRARPGSDEEAEDLAVAQAVEGAHPPR
ncbi:SURF1 family cytochrome oxidase biogenesis protein [Kineococcus sp. G2]|uniref:SURF1 family cytochrome oxidase biogenesis protein n=1 Tax=Kineococcus sp. G2 TaxID=3127484 RepID=UPI00301C1A65